LTGFDPNKNFRKEFLTPVSGEIKVDMEKKLLTVDLKIQHNGIISDFTANGTYQIRERIDGREPASKP